MNNQSVASKDCDSGSRSKKVAIFSPYATVAPHFETELEIAQRHYDRGDSVDYISCTRELANCDFNRNRDASACADCIGRRQHGLSLLSEPTRTQPFQILDPQTETPEFENLEQLKQHRIENFDIGYAVLSSLVSFCRDPEPDLQTHRDLIVRTYQSALATYQHTLRYIERKSPDLVYVFNGRFAAMRAILRACQSKGVECHLHERGCDQFHFDLFPNHLPHDIKGIDAAIQASWKAADPTQREKKGASWFHDRVNRVERNWQSFVKDQQIGTLPLNWDPNYHNVAIFCSSDDEFVAIGDAWSNKLYTNQLSAIQQLVDSFDSDDSVRLYVRMHPNLANAENKTKQQMLELDSPNLTIIAPTDPCDTYQLMRAADVVVTFGSSVGIEAVFWNKPSVLLGPCMYQHLPGTIQPKNHEEAVEQIGCRYLKPQDRIGALKYGHWFQTHGIEFNYFEPETLFHGRFKGQVVYAKPGKRTLTQTLRLRAGRFIKALVDRDESTDRAA